MDSHREQSPTLFERQLFCLELADRLMTDTSVSSEARTLAALLKENLRASLDHQAVLDTATCQNQQLSTEQVWGDPPASRITVPRR